MNRLFCCPFQVSCFLRRFNNGWEKSIVEFIIDHTVPFSLNQYTAVTVERVKKRFDDVVVFDYSDDRFRGSDESFYCHAMSNATNTCKAIRAEKEVWTYARSL